MAIWLFRTPTIREAPAGLDRLFFRIPINRGISIQELPQGVYRALRYPTQDEIADAYFFYLGGHEYYVDDAEKARLIAADIGVDESNFGNPAGGGGFGLGGFGEGGFGL